MNKMKRKNDIKVSFCVAYDWNLLEYSIPPVYEQADVICLSIDSNRVSWSGNPFSWNESGFKELIRRLDPEHKIVLLEDNYYNSEMEPMQNEVRQRNKIAEFLGAGGWHIQLDTDEFFLNFKGFVTYITALDSKRLINVSCPWITLYKQDKDGFYIVKPQTFQQIEFIQIATRFPKYEYGRRNGNFNVLSDYAILHLSWARSEAEIWEKLNNWGHKNDFDTLSYFNKWKDLNPQNYQDYRNFHHINPAIWPELEFIRAATIEELSHTYTKTHNLPISEKDLNRSNSIWYARFKKIINAFK